MSRLQVLERDGQPGSSVAASSPSTPPTASVLLLALFACVPAPRPPELEVEYGGCAAVLGSASLPTCVLVAERTLTLWARSDLGARLEVLAGESSWKISEGEPVGEGFRFELTQIEAGELVVRAGLDDMDATWNLALAPPRHSGLDETRRDVDEMRRLIGDEGYTAARRFLEERFEQAGTPLQAGILVGTMARLSLAAGAEQARDEAERAVALHRQSGNLSALVDDLTFLHYLLGYELEEVEAARDVLFREVPETASGDGGSAYLVAFYRGQWAVNTGNGRAALEDLGAAVRHAERVGEVSQRVMTQQLLGRQLRRLGQNEQATATIERLVAEVDELGDGCEKAKLYNEVAWDRLQALDARLPAEIPWSELEKALERVGKCPGRDREEQNLRLNLALAHLHAGHPEGARLELERVRTTEETPRWLLVWRHDVEGRIALAEGRPGEALGLYDALARLAEVGGGLDVAWRAAVGRAQALEAAGEVDAALEALGQAESLLDEESLRAPIDGRETSVAAREWGTRLYLDLLLDGRPREALAVARRARSRFFRGLARDARRQDLDGDAAAVVERYYLLRSEFEDDLAQDWAVPTRLAETLAAEREATRRELHQLLDQALALLGGVPDTGTPPPVAPGEVLLLYHPAPDGWFAFAAAAEGVDARRLGELDLSATRAQLADRLLEPFAESLARAGRVRVLPYGALRAIDFHALPFGGDTLLSASRPVVYGLDLPAAPGPSGRRALLIADPTGSLPAAAAEVASVERALARKGGWDVELFDDDTAALRDRLPAVDLLHFAGHVDFSGQDLGSAALESALAFDRYGAARLTAGDVLAHAGAPATVVLSACESARASATDAPVGLGVAHAFLLAGSRTVIAAVRRVDDEQSAALIRHFYDSWDTTPEGAATALAAAQLALRREDPEADWASFRVLER